MAVISQSSPFGPTRTRVLLALRLLSESYARELARLLDTPLSNVQKALAGLERDGLVAGAAVGRTRVFRINPRYFAREQLESYLYTLSEPEIELRRKIGTLRKRPRRTGKPL